MVLWLDPGAQDIGLSKSAVHRHKQECIGLTFREARASHKELSRGIAALARLPSREQLGTMYEALGQRIDRIVDEAEQSGSLAVAIQGLNALRGNLDSLAKLAGHTAPQAPQVNVGINIDAGSIAQKLASALAHASPKQIEAFIEGND